MARHILLFGFLVCATWCMVHGVAIGQEGKVDPGHNHSSRDSEPKESLTKFDVGGHAGHGRGRGRGPGMEMRKDQEVFHFLLEHHTKIEGTVRRLENGVETLTESDDPQVAAKIQEHVAAMHKRIKDGRGLRFWDELFAAIFQKSANIKMTVEETTKGVKVQETSEHPAVVALIQAHAKVVSQFVAHGFDEAQKNHPVPQSAPAASELEFPIVPRHGGVVPRPKAVEQPRAATKVILDVTTDAKPGEINKGLERGARLLNLYGAAGHKPNDVKIAVVLHGEATKSILKDAAYKSRFQEEHNPNLPLIQELRKAGVDVLVCGQALIFKSFSDDEVAEGISIAVSALTAVINMQSDGFSYILVP